MTDNGRAALAAALAPLLPRHQEGSGGYPHQSSYRTWTVYDFMAPDALATAILGPRGVFLPEGLGPVMVGMAKEIAALRAALEKVEHSHPGERRPIHAVGRVVAAWEADDIWEMNEAMPALRAALAAAKETP